MNLGKYTTKIWRNFHPLYPKSHNLRHTRNIFRCDGSWGSDLTIEMKRDIENHWKNEINAPYPTSKEAQKFYLLSMFPYPSGNLHMGHVRVYTISDAIARFLRMNGKKVIHPIGWDAFGLPAENAAIEKNVHPFDWTVNNIKTMKKQLKDINLSFDWDMELATCNPDYYKWTQYLFLLLYEQGLAYKKEALVNWDPIDQTVLADEQVDENGCSWRSGCKVEKRRLSQWFLRTSKFSKDLYDGLNDPNLVEWRDVVKIQKHWIGEPDGFIFHLKLHQNGRLLDRTLTVWTDAPELIYGATFVGISPDNHFNSPDYGGGQTEDHKLDFFAIHPLNGSNLPIFVSKNLDHSPATDSCLGISITQNEQFFNFATEQGITTTEVIDSTNHLINSGEFSGLEQKVAQKEVLNKVKTCGGQVYMASKKLRDWLISRQRYWGTPIPIINCPVCKSVPVSKEELPVLLPKLTNLNGKCSSLQGADDWIKVKCPKCGGSATRETDTMDTFVDSSWYFLRYLDVHNELEPFSVEKVDENMPIDLYIGGKEHAALHLFYARFIGHFLHSILKLKYREPFLQLLMQGMIMGKSYKVKDTGKYIRREEVEFKEDTSNLLRVSSSDHFIPVEKVSGATVIEQWEKMSKSKHNGIDPQEVIEEHGIDTARLFILGNVAPQSARKWNDELFPGIMNWQRRIWLTVSDFLEQRQNNKVKLTKELDEGEIYKYVIQLKNARNYYIKGVTHNFINTRQLNVAIAKLQGLTGELRRLPKVMAKSDGYEKTLGTLIIMLAPLAPHFASELWTAFLSAAANIANSYELDHPVLHQKWPEIDEDCEMVINIKLNGEDFDSILISREELLALSAEKAIKMALSGKKVANALKDIKIKHTRYKTWPNYDSEVHVIFKPHGKSSKKAIKGAKVAHSS